MGGEIAEQEPFLRFYGACGLYAGRSRLRLSRRAFALMCYLAAQPNTAFGRAALASLLWPKRFPAQARASLRQCLAELRAALPESDFVAFRGDVVALSKTLTTDISGFAHLEPSGLADALDQLPAGHALADLEIGPEFDRWVEQTRTRLETWLRNVTLEGLRKAAASRDWPALRRLGEAWLARSPNDTDVTALVMRADIELRAPAIAEARYERLSGAPMQASAHMSVPLPTAAPLLLLARVDDQTGSPGAVALALEDELLAALSRFRDLRLVREPWPLAQLLHEEAREGFALGVTVHEGAAIISLLELPSREVLWCGRTDLTGAALQDVIDEAVRSTAAALLPAVDAHALSRPHAAGRLYGQYLSARGRALRARSYSEAKAAADELEALIAAAPEFAPPMLALARLLNTDFGYTLAGASGPAERERAFALTRRALSLDRQHVHAYTVMGWCFLWRGDWRQAEHHFERAVALNPYHPDRLVEAGFGQLFLGNLEASSLLLERCLQLEAHLDDRFRADRGLLSLLSGEFEQALDDFELVHDRQGWVVLYDLAARALGGLSTDQVKEAATRWLCDIWPDRRLPDLGKLSLWIMQQRPFRLAAHRDLLMQGIKLGLY